MKTISIGRDESCDIVIIDKTNVVSRKHAVITIDNFGKMSITDYSSNGTYINGIKMSENVPVPITRKDIVSFAHASELNWDFVPNVRGRNIKLISISVFIVALISVLMIVVLNNNNEDPIPQPSKTTEPKEMVNDNKTPDTSTSVAPEEKKQEEKVEPEDKLPKPSKKSNHRNIDKEKAKPQVQEEKPMVEENKPVVEESVPVNPIIF